MVAVHTDDRVQVLIAILKNASFHEFKLAKSKFNRKIFGKDPYLRDVLGACFRVPEALSWQVRTSIYKYSEAPFVETPNHSVMPPIRAS